jgi:hypothetical protein
VEEAAAGYATRDVCVCRERGRRREDNNLSGGQGGRRKRCLVGCLWEDSAAECKRLERSSNRIHQNQDVIS